MDANAIIEGGEKLTNSADKFVTVPEVLAEIRDPVSRHRLAFIPFSIDSLEPSPDALNKGILNFNFNFCSFLFLRMYFYILRLPLVVIISAIYFLLLKKLLLRQK